MAKKSGHKKKRIAMALHCEVCNAQNYVEYSNPKKDSSRQQGKASEGPHSGEEKMKYCSNCKQHTKHIRKKIPKAN